MNRVGIGYDLHRVVEGRPLIIGGVTIPWDRGLSGHSDADVLCHAVTDALLGAAAMGDIGRWFPDTSADFKDADSVGLLKQVLAKVEAAGYRVVNLDANIIAEKPKMAPHIDAIRARLAECLGIGVDRVSVKAKTNEGVGPEGRGEAIAAQAIVLLENTGGAGPARVQ